MGQDTSVRSVEPWLREILRCPNCRGQLRDATPSAPSAKADEKVELPEAELHCSVCRVAYPINDGIPVLLYDKARHLGTEE